MDLEDDNFPLQESFQDLRIDSQSEQQIENLVQDNYFSLFESFQDLKIDSEQQIENLVPHIVMDLEDYYFPLQESFQDLRIDSQSEQQIENLESQEQNVDDQEQNRIYDWLIYPKYQRDQAKEFQNGTQQFFTFFQNMMSSQTKYKLIIKTLLKDKEQLRLNHIKEIFDKQVYVDLKNEFIHFINNQAQKFIMNDKKRQHFCKMYMNYILEQMQIEIKRSEELKELKKLKKLKKQKKLKELKQLKESKELNELKEQKKPFDKFFDNRLRNHPNINAQFVDLFQDLEEMVIIGEELLEISNEGLAFLVWLKNRQN